MSSAPAPAQRTIDLRSVVQRFVDGFNTNSLDEVMEFFADDAVYRMGDEPEHRGRAGIRAAFEPQFRGAWGKMYFDVDEMIVDEVERRAALSWTCRHDLAGDHGRAVPILKRLFLRLLYGERPRWDGMDFFHFDARGKILSKVSHAFARRPRVRRS